MGNSPYFDRLRMVKLGLIESAPLDGHSLYAFFSSLRSGMTGRCLVCGGKTQKFDKKTFHFSLSHILPKSKFPSVALVKENIIELCFYGNSCHKNFDDGILTIEELATTKAWPVIRKKLEIVLPMVSANERSRKEYSRMVALIQNT